MAAQSAHSETPANENVSTVLRPSDRALSLLGRLDSIVAESVDHPNELTEDGIIPVFFDKDELDSFRNSLERLACDLRDEGQ